MEYPEVKLRIVGGGQRYHKPTIAGEECPGGSETRGNGLRLQSLTIAYASNEGNE